MEIKKVTKFLKARCDQEAKINCMQLTNLNQFMVGSFILIYVNQQDAFIPCPNNHSQKQGFLFLLGIR